ncbi:MAG: serine/threonine protein kinase [Deltaproteobacteria bacterium]|nr:serine/threonine protein kinase [Deltaproteobacteria bacterium]
MNLQPGQWIGGELRIVRPLAEGGMGAIFLAEQRGTGKLRAVKTLHAPIARDAAAVERFVREARVGASIASEHIVEVVSAGIDEPTGLAFIAMELLEGETLEERVLSRGPMLPSEVALVFRQLAHALGAAHRVGIVHRDLKPQNVMLVHARRGDSPFTVKVLDFGIAKLVESATGAGNSQVIGSPPWMAPEQLDAGAPITPATDVWSVGLIAFFLLTGRVYWRSATASIPALFAEIVLSPLEPASVRARELGSPTRLSPGFDAWFARAVARAPADRFASVDALLASLIPLMETASPSPHDVATRSRPPAAAPSAPLAPTVASSPPAALAYVPAPGTTPPAPASPATQRSLAPAPAPDGRRGYRVVVGVMLVASLAIILFACVSVGGIVYQWVHAGYVVGSALAPYVPGPESMAACSQASACCWAVHGPTSSTCPSVQRLAEYGHNRESCIRVTQSTAALRRPPPAACLGPPANVVAPPPPARTQVPECVRAVACCDAFVDARLSLVMDECGTVRSSLAIPHAASACTTAVRNWAERFRSAGRAVPPECQLPP